MGNEKDARELINENLTDEEMQDLMASYKKELAHVYKMASAKKAALVRRNLPYIKAELEKCRVGRKARSGDIKETIVVLETGEIGLPENVDPA